MGNLKLKHEVNQEVLQLLNTLKLVNSEAANSETFKNEEEKAKNKIKDLKKCGIADLFDLKPLIKKIEDAGAEAQKNLLPDGDKDKVLGCIDDICTTVQNARSWHHELFDFGAYTLYSIVVKANGKGGNIPTTIIKKLFELTEKMRAQHEPNDDPYNIIPHIQDKAITIIRIISELEPTAENINLATEYTFTLAFGGKDSLYTKMYKFIREIEDDPSKFGDDGTEFALECMDKAIKSSSKKKDNGEVEPGGADKVDPSLARFLFHAFISVRHLIPEKTFTDYLWGVRSLAYIIPDDGFADVEEAIKILTDYGNYDHMEALIKEVCELRTSYVNFLKTSESPKRQEFVEKINEILKNFANDPKMPAELKIVTRTLDLETSEEKPVMGVRAIQIIKDVALIDQNYGAHGALPAIAKFVVIDVMRYVRDAVLFGKVEIIKKQADEEIKLTMDAIKELCQKVSCDRILAFRIYQTLAKMAAYTATDKEGQIVFNTNKDLVKDCVATIVQLIEKDEANAIPNTPEAKAAIENLFNIGLFYNEDEEINNDIIEKLKKLKEVHKNFSEKTDGYICVLSKDENLETVQIIKKNLTNALYDIELNRNERNLDYKIKAIGDAIAEAAKGLEDETNKKIALLTCETGFKAYAQIMEALHGLLRGSYVNESIIEDLKKMYDKTVEIYGNAKGLELETAFGPYCEFISKESDYHLNILIDSIKSIVKKNKEYNVDAARILVKTFLKAAPKSILMSTGLSFINELIKDEDTPEKRVLLFNSFATCPLEKRGFQSDIKRRLNILEGVYKNKKELINEVLDAIYGFYVKNKNNAAKRDQEEVQLEPDQSQDEEGNLLTNAQFLSNEVSLLLGKMIEIQTNSKLEKLNKDEKADTAEEDKIIKKATKYVRMIDGTIVADDYMEKIIVDGKVDPTKVDEGISLEEKKKIYNALNSKGKVNSIASDPKYWNPVISQDVHNAEIDLLNDVVTEIENLCESDLASGDLGFAESVMTALKNIFMMPELEDPEDTLRMKIASIFVKIANKYPKAEVNPETHDIKKDEHNRVDMIGSWIDNQVSFFMLQVKERLLIDLKQKVLDNIKEYINSADLNSTQEANIIYDTLNDLQVPAVRNMRHAGVGPNPAMDYFNVLALAKKKYKTFGKEGWDYRRRPVGK